VVTAQHQGYTSLAAASGKTGRVVFGTVSFDRPEVRGKLLVGHTLTARIESLQPASATASYRWLRDGTPIRGARGRTYAATAADLGHRIRVEVTMRADHWVERSRRSPAAEILTAPRLHPHVSIAQGRVLLRLGVTSPGLTAPDGRVNVWRGHRRVGHFSVIGGSGSALLASLRRGKHELTIVYRGSDLETVARRTLVVKAP
jgi:hypothetical protein